MNRRFWSGKRAFITGHTGFKGGWLSAWLLDLGATVAGYALAPASPRALFVDAALGREMESTLGDVRDRGALLDAMREARPDIIFHLAAQPLVRESYERPLETFSTNVLGTVNVLDCARALPSVRAAIIVTSDKCYDLGHADRRHAEGDPLGGNDPYSASKACAEIVAASFRESYSTSGVAIATARAGNVVGGGDWAKDRLIPDLLRAFDQGTPATIRQPGAVRPWQHVLDPLAGYLTLAAALCEAPAKFGAAWNFGPPAAHEIAVAALADIAVRAWGRGAAWHASNGTFPRESPALRLDSSKAARELGWHAVVPLEPALRWTIEWHRERESGANPRALLRRDITRYESLLG